MMLPAAKPTRVMPIITHIIPTALPNTNPPSSHRTTDATIAITRVRVLEFIFQPFLSNSISTDFSRSQIRRLT